MIRTKNDKTKPTEIIINYYHCLVWLNEATLFTVNGDKTWGGKHNKSIQRGKFIYILLFIYFQYFSGIVYEVFAIPVGNTHFLHGENTARILGHWFS